MQQGAGPQETQLKRIKDPNTPAQTDLHTEPSTRNFSDHRHRRRASDIWVLAVVEPTYTFLGTACKPKNCCGGKQIPQGPGEAGAAVPREPAETGLHAWLCAGRAGCTGAFGIFPAGCKFPGTLRIARCQSHLNVLWETKHSRDLWGKHSASSQSKEGEGVVAKPSKFTTAFGRLAG